MAILISQMQLSRTLIFYEMGYSCFFAALMLATPVGAQAGVITGTR